MKFPNYINQMTKSLAVSALVLLAVLLFTASKTSAQAADIDQCRNGKASAPVGCSGSSWVNGNAGAQNSHWTETQFIAYRDVMTGLTPGTSYTITIGYDILHNGRHAVDYLGSYNATETTADPCSDISGCSLGTFTTFPIPEDTFAVTNNINPNTGLPIVQQPGVFTLFGGTITDLQYTTYTAGDIHRSIIVTFTAGSATEVLAWGGHIAWAGDWGVGNSAGGISGSPYHGSQDACSFGCGAQDRSMSAAAVAPTATLNVQKEVQTANCSDYSTIPFNFSASSNATVANVTPATSTFSLLDDAPGHQNALGQCDVGGHDFTPGAPTQLLVSFAPNNPASIAVTVSELVAAGGAAGAPSAWNLLDVRCVDLATSTFVYGGNPPLAGPTASFNISQFAVVTCTFRNSPKLQVTAAPASVTGKVTTASGDAIKNVAVTLTELNPGGVVLTTTTNGAGSYKFDHVDTEKAYRVSISAQKKYSFSTDYQTFTLTGDIVVNFTSSNR